MNFIKGSLFTVASKATMFLSSIFISIYVARILGPEAKGIYYLLVQMASIIALFAIFGINNSAVYFLGKKRMPQPEVYTHLLFLTALSSVAFFIIVTALHGVLLGSVLKGIPGEYVRIVTFGIPLLMLNYIFLSIFLGLNRIVLYNVFQIISYLLLFLNFVVFVIGLRMALYGACLGFVVTYLVMNCVFIFFCINKIALRIRWKRIKDILHYGLRSFLGHICFLCILRVDSFVLNFFSGVRQVGFYSIAVSFAELLPFVPLAVGTVLFPKLASQETDTLNVSTATVVRVMFSFLLLTGLIFFLAAKWITLFIYGDMYTASILPLRVLLPGFVFISLYYLFFSYFAAVGKPEIVTAILIATLFIKFFSSIFAVARWGLVGAAGVSTISYILCGSALLIAFWIRSRQSLRDIFVIKRADIKYVWKSF